MKALVLACGIPTVAMIWAIGISFALLDGILGWLEHFGVEARTPR